MPVLNQGNTKIDYIDEGQGQPVVLIHSSVSGNRQWRALIELLKGRYRLLAINLFGYGETTPWSGRSPQSLYAQAQLVLALCKDLETPIHLIGHSFGGSVALKSAMLLGQKVGRLILLEPNPFYLLEQDERMKAFLEVRDLRNHVKYFGSLGDWSPIAERFADYWLGEGSWNSMPEKRRNAFVGAMQPNFYEWDAVMDEETTVEELKALNTRTMVIYDKSTRFPILEIVDILMKACPNWTFRIISEGGHMAAFTHPEIVNPIIRDFLIAS
jgi:pimeloyl-ACP methyl ester carboxylesterase